MEKVILEENILKDQLLQVMIDNEWSDMYITVWAYPAVKIWWEIIFINENIEKLKWKDTLEFVQSIISEKQHYELMKNKNLDFSLTFGNRRFRVNISFQLSNYMVVLRLLTSEIPSLDKLHLPDIFKEVTKKWQWIILVTWPTWSWKTTTMAAIIDYINSNYEKHIITIEDPIEYIHDHKKSIIEHKEIWKDVPNYETALVWAMRQSPDIIFFGEMRSKEEIRIALTLAETGHLVLSTLHTRWAYQTITRIMDSFEWQEKSQIRMQLADSLVSVFSQRLLKTRDGTWIRMAKEILVNSWAVANLIRENELHQLPSVLQMWTREWMQILEKDIVDLINMWFITEDEGIKYANNPKLIKESLY